MSCVRLSCCRGRSGSGTWSWPATIANRGSIREASAVLHVTQPRDVAFVERARTDPRCAAVRPGTQGDDRHRGQVLLSSPTCRSSPPRWARCCGMPRRSSTAAAARCGWARSWRGTADILPSAVFEVVQRFPDVRVAISEGTPDRLHEDLMSGQVDFVAGRVTPLASMPGVDVEPLYDDDVQVVCTPGHPRSGHRGSLAELVDDTWILPPRDTSLRLQIEAAFIRACGRTPGNVTECVAAVPLRALVLRGRHLAVVPSGIFADDLERDTLVSLPVTASRAPRSRSASSPDRAANSPLVPTTRSSAHYETQPAPATRRDA